MVYRRRYERGAKGAKIERGERERHRVGGKDRDGCYCRPADEGRTAERERASEKIATRELKQRGRERLCPSAGARISHLHRNKLAGTIGSSVHSEHCKHGATVFPWTNRKPLQYALLTLSPGPIIDPSLSFVCRTIISYLVTFSRDPREAASTAHVGPRPRCLFHVSFAHVRAMNVEKSLTVSRPNRLGSSALINMKVALDRVTAR